MFTAFESELRVVTNDKCISGCLDGVNTGKS